jgi:hypothetical protein
MTPYAPIIINAFPNVTNEEIICRGDPSTAIVNRYLDGSSSGSFNFSYYTKSKTQSKASDQLNAILAALDLTTYDELGIKIDIVSSPVMVSKTDAGVYIFSASLRLEY